MNEPAHRARLLYQRDPGPTASPSGHVPGKRFVTYLLNSTSLVFVIQVAVALARREAAFLSLCFLTVAPFLLPIPWIAGRGARKETEARGKAAESSKRGPGRKGRVARELSRLRAATKEDRLGPAVEGEGTQGWITRRGCYMTDGTYFPWRRIGAVEWHAKSGDNLGLTLTVTRDWLRLMIACVLIVLGCAALVSGSLFSFVLAWAAIPEHGLRMDLVAAVWLDLIVWIILAYFMAVLRCKVRNPCRGGRLQVLVNRTYTTRDQVAMLLPGRVREHQRNS